ncbi:tRNA (adenosine(37)-N6)-dimethylallyltransferase MiaA [Flavobacterium pallidum]|uniref:tRNA dimethylallyltransferase n=1 Tax=Flavobacterium pallidum TaxID=2172098 RepID=A0A2S1SHX9_9FLAO|nr:tRNA (adenosine(37)-N6)-dimethylallyltransferase MiaA [Flavobacterium pallidum]AWI25969.1 tRNA (adenosine(37)-N6)-dimethylallyltransferase MiaA [Flavobacterium pallidum]
MPKFLITIVGPTAIGKTAMAIHVAKHFNCDIISCDSRQFFKEMTIGTAVPSDTELQSATHHFIHNKSIFDEYNVGDFEKEAITKLEGLFLENDFVVMTGGSGLYVDAVLKGFDDFPDVDPEVRTGIASQYDQHGIFYLQHQLQQLDPDYFSVVDTGNPQRMMRALEVSIGTGKPYSYFLKQKTNQRNFTNVIIGLDADREIIYDRINRRVDMMIHDGLLAEAEKLFTHKNLNALQTVGYRELFDYFEGKYNLDFAISEIKKNTRRFAKRQLTWFRRNVETKWFDYETDPKVIIAYIQQLVIHNPKCR